MLARVYFPYLVAGYKEGIEQGKAQTRADTTFSDAVAAAIKRKAYAHAAIATGNTKKKLQELLAKALTEGLGVRGLADEIEDEFGSMARYRTLNIARTELTGTINEATYDVLEGEGQREKEWSTVIDGAQRPSHGAANGQVVGINDLFKVGDGYARFPGDDRLPAGELVNCRCAVLGAGLSGDRKRHVGRRFLRVHGSLERKFVVALRRSFAAQRARVLSHFPS